MNYDQTLSFKSRLYRTLDIATMHHPPDKKKEGKYYIGLYEST